MHNPAGSNAPTEASQSITVASLAREIDDALQLLKDYGSVTQSSALPAENALPGLIDQCMAMCALPPAISREPIRTIHHMACTGGTLISKCLAAMPNAQLLSEIDPLSEMPIKGERPQFAPTDMVIQARQSTRGVRPEMLVEFFLTNLDVLYRDAERGGLRLVLRDHAHSQFCTRQDAAARPTLREMLRERHEVLSVVTVRDPLESYIALRGHKWVHFEPATLEEYCARYLVFLQRHEGIAIFKYEDFVVDPQRTMRRMCDVLQMPYQDQFELLFDVFKLTGDSGRKGDQIAPRPPRQPDELLRKEAGLSESYRKLEAVLGYDSSR